MNSFTSFFSLVLLVAMTAMISCTNTSPQQIIDKFFMAPDFTFAGSAGDLFPAQIIQTAEKAYQEGNYDQAVTTLQEMPFTSGSYNHSVYLVATIALRQGNGQLAVDQYNYYLKSQDQRFIEQAKLSLALAYLANDQKDQAIEQINKILENKNHFSRSYVEAAREIQQLLNTDL